MYILPFTVNTEILMFKYNSNMEYLLEENTIIMEFLLEEKREDYYNIELLEKRLL